MTTLTESSSIISDPNSGSGFSIIGNTQASPVYASTHLGGPGGSGKVVIEGDLTVNGNINHTGASIDVNSLIAERQQAQKERDEAIAERDLAAGEAEQWYALYKTEKKKHEDLLEQFENLKKSATELAAAVREEAEELKIRDKHTLDEATKSENLWNAIERSTIPNDFREYLKRYPNGIHAQEAADRLKKWEERDAQNTVYNPPRRSGGHRTFA